MANHLIAPATIPWPPDAKLFHASLLSEPRRCLVRAPFRPQQLTRPNFHTVGPARSFFPGPCASADTTNVFFHSAIPANTRLRPNLKQQVAPPGASGICEETGRES